MQPFIKFSDFAAFTFFVHNFTAKFQAMTAIGSLSEIQSFIERWVIQTRLDGAQLFLCSM